MVEPLRHRQTKGAATDMFYLTPPRHISTLPRLCENSDIQLACRTSISISSIWESIVLATSFGRRQLRKQFCASFAQARFHTALDPKRTKGGSLVWSNSIRATDPLIQIIALSKYHRVASQKYLEVTMIDIPKDDAPCVRLSRGMKKTKSKSEIDEY